MTKPLASSSCGGRHDALVLLAPRSSPSTPTGENHVAPSKRQINEI